MTKKQIADRIMTSLRANSKDRGMSKRYILHIAEEKMRFLLAQKLRDRSLFREENIFSQVDCYEFEEIDRVKCDIVEFRMCDSIMKGKKRLPELIFTRFGDSIRMIANLDHSEIIKRTTPVDFARNKKRKGYDKQAYYYVRDGYPYLLNTKMEAGFIEMITLDTKTVEEISCNCPDNNCKSALDYEFIGSDKLKEVVVQQTLQELMQSYAQIQPDENPDLNEKSI